MVPYVEPPRRRILGRTEVAGFRANQDGDLGTVNPDTVLGRTVGAGGAEQRGAGRSAVFAPRRIPCTSNAGEWLDFAPPAFLLSPLW